MKLALLQTQVTGDKSRDLDAAAGFVRAAAREGADMAVLPEMFCCPYQASAFPVYAEPDGGRVFSALSDMARQNGVILIGGSVPERDGPAVYNTSYAFDRAGALIAKHRKMHLFDICVDGGQVFRESDTLSAGDRVTVMDTEFGPVGLMICYDIRFPELCRLTAERGARLIVAPGAFNMTTGPAHWELTLRARALDNQVFMAGCAPARDEKGVYVSYGHSTVTSPWGDVLLRMDEREGLRCCTLDFDRVEAVRRQLPLRAHRRTDVYELRKRT